MKKFLPIQSEEAIVRTIHRFCIAIALSSAFNIFVYLFLGLYYMAAIVAGVGLLFVWFAWLNHKSYHSIARSAIITATNVLVLTFSIFLGYKSGIYLYLFAAPLLTYLLYDFKQKKAVYLCFASYLVTYALTFIIEKFHLYESIGLPGYIIDLIYVFNFFATIILCIILTVYFAHNNSIYTGMLIDTNKQLEEKQFELQKEIAEKSKAHEELKKILREKEILLQEIHHRVKNNLAVISGLVELQNFYVKDEKASSVLKESRNRIKSIALLHEKFYESESLEKIEIRSYIDELIHFIKLSFSTQNKDIKIHTRIDRIELSLIDALPFSLLLNELITNSYKHAFNEKDVGNIYISFIKTPGGLVFNFKDDGCGFDYNSEMKENTLGLNLIEAFSKQLKGELSYNSIKGVGTELKLYFKP